MEQQTQNIKQSIPNSAPDSAGKTFAYVRVSSKTQNEARQLAALSEYGIEPDTIYIDRQSGKDFNRPAYLEMLDALQQGDLLVIGSIDRLGRNYEEIHEQWYRLTREKKVHIRVLDMDLLDTRTSTDLTGTLIADIVLKLLSYVAQKEHESIHRRQAEGIAAAKARGVRLGKEEAALPDDFPEWFARWRRREITGKELTGYLGVHITTVYRRARKLGLPFAPEESQ
ncbi:MAG: recombinase family protein [Lachnospiraceae bacterium]|nr:recombinase family protein [Lachnospiraceae bacterium]